MGRIVVDVGCNGYSDEETLVVARHLHSLQDLSVNDNKLGWEGVASVASSLTKLEVLSIQDNKEVGQGVAPLGRLPTLKELSAGTYESMQEKLK